MKKVILIMLCLFGFTSNIGGKDNQQIFTKQNAVESIKEKHASQISKMKLAEIPKLTKSQEKIYARITFYHKFQDQYGDKIASGNGRAKQGKTVAAHPKFKFGTKIEIPNLKNIIGSSNFVVEDRGSAVTKKTASNKKLYVFDVYINARSKKEGDLLIKKYSNMLGENTYVLINNT